MIEMMELGASAATGGVFGLVGTLFGRAIGIFEMRERRQDRRVEMEHEERRWKQENEAARLRMEAGQREAESELALTDAAGAWSALKASHAAEAGIAASYRWIDAMRATVRPALTLGLWLAVLVIFFRTAADQAQWLAEAERSAAIAYMIDAVVFAAMAATLWWFGDRPRRGGARAADG